MGCSTSRPIAHSLRKPEPHHHNYHSFASPSPSPSPSASNAFNYYSPSSPVPRAFSLPTPLVHHPALRKGDTHHLVSLTSTTYGSLLLIDRPMPKTPNLNGQVPPDPPDPKTPSPPHRNLKISTNPSDPEVTLSPDSVFNTWELMDGLDDFDFDTPNPIPSSTYDPPFQNFQFLNKLTSPLQNGSPKNLLNPTMEESVKSSKPLWKLLSEESLLSKLNQDVDSCYRRALSSRMLTPQPTCKTPRSVGSSPLSSSFSTDWVKLLPGTEDRIVIYFTSLRGIRKTYDDCCSARMILRGFRVSLDERDTSMDSSYRNELQSALGKKAVSLPQVFIRGKHIGGAEDVKQLNENGQLGKLLEGFPVREFGFVCDSCGDARFVPCPNCNGSRKVFEEEEGESRRCPDCNENGLIKCPACCSS